MRNQIYITIDVAAQLTVKPIYQTHIIVEFNENILHQGEVDESRLKALLIIVEGVPSLTEGNRRLVLEIFF